uniref:Uncharacterized protein n=1 Tax=Acrobeloides nanus TaxID=290746 RepID=A0A914C0T4_9BILA
MKWPHGAYPNVWLTIYISLYAVCIPLCFLLFAFGVFKSGNIAGDNERLGARTERILEITRRTREKRLCSPLVCIRNMWQHSPPIPQTIHVIAALCQLFAQQAMLAQLYRFGFINSGDFLNTEMDFLYQRARQLATNLPVGDTKLQSFPMTFEKLSNSPVSPNLLPILMHARLFGIPLEFFNLLLALLAYACTYSS